MAKCRKCGREAGVNKRYCYSCRVEWHGKGQKAINQAIEEIGPLNVENIEAIYKRVKQLEGAP